MIYYSDDIKPEVREHSEKIYKLLNLLNWKIIIESMSFEEKKDDLDNLENVGQNNYIWLYLESNIKLDTSRSLEFQKETLTHELLHLVLASIEVHIKYRVLDKIDNPILYEDAHALLSEEVEHLVVIWTRILTHLII